MSTEQELAFADQVGRHYARQYGLPPMVGRVAGWLMVCDPPEQTAGALAQALHASRSSIGNAISALEGSQLVVRARPAGERVDRVSINPDYAAQSLEAPAEYGALAGLARYGLEVLADAPPERRARLAELAAFADFLLERMPSLAAEWRERKAALRTSGALPAPGANPPQE